MASSTRARVASSTLVWPFDTRETVCDETPARRATSAIDGRGTPARLLVVGVMGSPAVSKLMLACHVSRALCLRKHSMFTQTSYRLDEDHHVSQPGSRGEPTGSAAPPPAGKALAPPAVDGLGVRRPLPRGL